MSEFEKWFESKKNDDFSNKIIKHEQIKKFLYAVKDLLFPGYDDYIEDLKNYLDLKLSEVRKTLLDLLCETELIEPICECGTHECIIDNFLEKLPEVDRLLNTDIEAIYSGDPAANSTKEIIICYPGFRAIFTYRIAHILYDLNIPILPRALSEYAHSKTGIDIHPGAKIKNHFCIDHGTGIVIGETAEIGEHVKIYQGVTLGALSLAKGQALKGNKRHPSIKDYVTIYSGASIFGGETVIGSHTTIGSNAYITSSVDEYMLVTIDGMMKKKVKH